MENLSPARGISEGIGAAGLTVSPGTDERRQEDHHPTHIQGGGGGGGEYSRIDTSLSSTSASLRSLKLKNLTPTRLLSRQKRRKNSNKLQQIEQQQRRQDDDEEQVVVAVVVDKKQNTTSFTGGSVLTEPQARGEGTATATASSTTTTTTTMPVSPFGKAESLQFFQEMKSELANARRASSVKFQEDSSDGVDRLASQSSRIPGGGGGGRTPTGLQGGFASLRSMSSTPRSQTQMRDKATGSTPAGRHNHFSPTTSSASSRGSSHTGFFVLDSAIEDARKVLDRARCNNTTTNTTTTNSISLDSPTTGEGSLLEQSVYVDPPNISRCTFNLEEEEEAVIQTSSTPSSHYSPTPIGSSSTISGQPHLMVDTSVVGLSTSQSAKEEQDVGAAILSSQKMDHGINSTLSQSLSVSSSSPKTGDGDVEEEKKEDHDEDQVSSSGEPPVTAKEPETVSSLPESESDAPVQIVVGKMSTSSDHPTDSRTSNSSMLQQNAPSSSPASRGMLFELFLLGLVFLAMLGIMKYFGMIVQPPFDKDVLRQEARKYIAAGDDEVFKSLSMGLHSTSPLKDVVVVMTETASGLGSNVAHGFSVLGATVASLQVDCTDLESVSKSVDSILDSFKRVDYVINTGNLCLWETPATNVSVPIPFVGSSTRQGYDTLFAGNYLSSFLMTQKVIPILERSKFRTLVQFTSPVSFFVDGTHHQVDNENRGGDPALSSSVKGGGNVGAAARLPRRFADVKLAEVLHVRTLKRIYPKINVMEVSKDPSSAGRDVREFFKSLFEIPTRSSTRAQPVSWNTPTIISGIFNRMTEARDDKSLQDDFYDWSFDAVQEWTSSSTLSSLFFQHASRDSQTSSSSSSSMSSASADEESHSIIPKTLKRYIEVGSTTMFVSGMSILAWKWATSSTGGTAAAATGTTSH